MWNAGHLEDRARPRDNTFMKHAETIFSRNGLIGHIVLNRPHVLNALSPAQFPELNRHLAAWEADDTVRLVLIEGAGERAFSAGGDIRAAWDARARGDDAFTVEIFRQEYRMDRRIHHYAKPYVALMDGIVMGGGAGASVNGRYRVATERTMFAMPETAIGFFPDVGATHFLSRCPGRIGLYLGMTGTRLGAADCVWAGIATHYVPSGDLPALKQALAETPGEVDGVLAHFHRDPGRSELAERAEAVERCFAGATAAEVIARVAEEGADWACQASAGFRANAPTAIATAFRQLVAGKTLSFDDAIRQEFRLACAFVAGDEFYEGIRALVVDKDRQPRWSPARLADIDDAQIDRLFAGTGDELTFED